MSKKKLFISHASKDKPLVEAFEELLERGVGVHPTEIFCSSLKGLGIKPGVDFKESIRGNLGDATCVIAIISPNFYNSAFSMCELGGVWLQAKSVIPIIVPPIKHTDLKAVLAGVQVLKIEDEADLDQLRDALGERIDIKLLPTPRWNEKRNNFLKKLPKIFKSLPKDSPVPHEIHQKIVEELKEYKEELSETNDEIDKLRKTVTELSKIKDAKPTLVVLKKNMGSTEQFEALVKSAKHTLQSLSNVVHEALYYRYRGENYYPKDEPGESDDVKLQIEYGQLELSSDEDGYEVIHIIESNAKVGNVIKALDELKHWLEDEAPEEFFKWYDSDFDGEDADIKLRSFWERHL